jgi:hypothetical protein
MSFGFYQEAIERVADGCTRQGCRSPGAACPQHEDFRSVIG